MSIGIPAEAFEFYEHLAADPTKSWWDAHKGEYDTTVRAPLLALGEALADEFGTPKLFRPYRDVRFSKDKSPYKDHQGMYTELAEGVGYYLQVSATGLMAAGGWYSSGTEQVAQFRSAVGEEVPAATLRSVLDGVRAAGLEVGGEQLKSRPRGVAADHPNLDLLRYKTLYGQTSWEPRAWMEGDELLARVRQTWSALQPLCEWLAATVDGGEAS